MLPTSAGVEPATSWSPVGRRIQLSHRGRLGLKSSQNISHATYKYNSNGMVFIIWLIINSTIRSVSKYCLFVLRFYGPVNPLVSCRAQSVYPTTHSLGRLSPLRVNQYCAHSFATVCKYTGTVKCLVKAPLGLKYWFSINNDLFRKLYIYK